MSSRFLENYRQGRLQLGTLFMGDGTSSMHALAKAGYTWVMLDFMFGWNDWSRMHHMILAARAEGLSPIIRIPAYPWSGKTDADHALLVDAARAASLNPEGVAVTIDSLEQLKHAAHFLKDWHRAGFIQETAGELATFERSIREDMVLMAIVESVGALKDFESIIAFEGVRAVMMSGSDLPRQLGFPYEYEHPAVYKYLERAVELGRKHHVAIGMNSGYIYTGVDETVARIKRLRAVGVDLCLTQTDYHMLYSYAKSLVQGVGPDAVKGAKKA